MRDTSERLCYFEPLSRDEADTKSGTQHNLIETWSLGLETTTNFTYTISLYMALFSGRDRLLLSIIHFYKRLRLKQGPVAERLATGPGFEYRIGQGILSLSLRR